MRLPANTGARKIDVASYTFIMKVQHLIERCLTFDLDQDDCVKALSKHAGIEPIITVTVWKELEQANKQFFEDYFCERLARRSFHLSRVLEDTTNKLSRHSLEDINKKIKGKIPKP